MISVASWTSLLTVNSRTNSALEAHTLASFCASVNNVADPVVVELVFILRQGFFRPLSYPDDASSSERHG